MFAIFRESDRNGTNANKSDDYDRKVIIVALRILNRLFFFKIFLSRFFFFNISLFIFSFMGIMRIVFKALIQ